MFVLFRYVWRDRHRLQLDHPRQLDSPTQNNNTPNAITVSCFAYLVMQCSWFVTNPLLVVGLFHARQQHSTQARNCCKNVTGGWVEPALPVCSIGCTTATRQNLHRQLYKPNHLTISKFCARNFFMWSWKTIITICGGITTVAATATVLGIKELPRPAWASEVYEVAENMVELDSRLTSQQLDDTKLRLYQNLREQRQADRDENAIPTFLLKEQTELERQIDNLQNHLDNLRKATQ